MGKLQKAFRKMGSDIYQNKVPLAIVVAYLCITQLIFGWVCPVKILTGKECPGCGLTRGCLCILTGQWKRAVDYNPMSFAWMGLLAWLIYCRYFTDKQKLHWEAPVIVISIVTIFYWIWRWVQ